jgi:hypothetical protein
LANSNSKKVVANSKIGPTNGQFQFKNNGGQFEKKKLCREYFSIASAMLYKALRVKMGLASGREGCPLDVSVMFIRLHLIDWQTGVWGQAQEMAHVS